ncbi:MAG: SoxXA-binding protein [Pseudomonadota bacterium]
MRKTFLTLASALTLAACSSGGGTSAEADEVRQAIAAAEEEKNEAAEMGFEWRDTGKFIDQAQDAMEEGKYDKAMELARKAESQGEQAQKQARAQADAGPEVHMEEVGVN